MDDSRRAAWRRYLRFLRPDLRADVEDELAFHLEMHATDLVRGGRTEAAAREEAERRFGNLAAIRSLCISIDERRFRRANRRESLMTFFGDVRLAARGLGRVPGFTAVAIACLALGIAATTSIFSAARGLFLRPLPFPDGDRLASVFTAIPARGESRVNVSYHDYYVWRTGSRTFTDIGLWTWNMLTISSPDESEQVEAAQVTANLFPILGVAPMLGRQFTPDEEQPGVRVILLGYGLWRRRFGGDSSIVGRVIRVNAESYTVVGVMPPAFSFPDRGQAWSPLPSDMANDPGNRFYASAIGRLKPGVSLAAAGTDLESIMQRQRAELPDDYEGFSADVRSFRNDAVGEMRRPLLVFLGAVAMVLLIVCANVANLMVARDAARSREVAIRAALGAGRGRLFGHALIESGLLALAGALLGVCLTPWGIRLFTLAYPNNVPFYFTLGMDGPVVGLVLLLMVLSTLFMGLYPAWRATVVDVDHALREGARVGRGRHAGAVRNALVVAELALSVMLLVGATLLVRSYRALANTHLGFEPQGRLAVRVSLPQVGYQDRAKRRAYWESAYQRLAALPGVTVVGSAQGIPFSGWNVMASMAIEGQPVRSRSNWLDVHYQNVSPGYFPAIGARIVRGRNITEADRDSGSYVGVINETLARKEFAGQDPIGKRMKWGEPDSEWPWITIVGVVGDFRHWRLPQPMPPAIYLSQLARPSLAQTIVLRTTLAHPRGLERAIRDALRALEPDAPAYQVETFDEVVSSSLWRQRLQSQVLGLFAGMAMFLAALGIYGVVSYAVAQRTRELGVRMALGASRRRVAALVLAQSARLVALGTGIGLAGAFLLRSAIAQLLYQVAPTDPMTMIGVPVALAVVALGASLVPAQRAARVDPAVSMRAE